MAETGILPESERLELIEGKIIGMSPVSSEHACCTSRLGRSLMMQAGSLAEIRIQQPLTLSEWSEPELDILVARLPDTAYLHRHPGPADIWFVAEVSRSSLEYDREVKLPLYAQAAIPEVWIIDLAGRQAEIYSGPAAGQYRSRTIIGPEEVLEFPALGIAVRLGELLP
jgi:hypothetical protein